MLYPCGPLPDAMPSGDSDPNELQAGQMLALTKKTDYALIAMAVMSNRQADVISAREIAAMTKVPQAILTNILKMLSTAGLVTSVRGANGGYALARPVANISLRELITAIEGPIQFVQCALEPAESRRSPCELESSCPVRSPALRVHDRLDSFLANVSLEEIVADAYATTDVHAIQVDMAPTNNGAITELTS